MSINIIYMKSLLNHSTFGESKDPLVKAAEVCEDQDLASNSQERLIASNCNPLNGSR